MTMNYIARCSANMFAHAGATAKIVAGPAEYFLAAFVEREPGLHWDARSVHTLFSIIQS